MKIRKYIAIILATTMCVGLMQPFAVKAEAGRVETLLGNMTLEEKIEQMMMVDFRKWDEDLTDETEAQDFVEMNEQVREIVENYNFGSIIYFANNIKDTEQSYNLTMEMQKAATQNGGIPMLIATDQEGGSVYRLGSGTALPGNMALGATNDETYTKQAGQIVGSELSAIGINTDLAPVVDVNNNANNPVIGLRSYGDDAETVGKLASVFVEGLNEYNVVGCAKHFPGHGDTATDSHYGLPSVDKSKEELLENELKPYQILINQGLDMIMTAHILYPQLDDTKLYSEKTGQEESLPATMSEKIITDLLKDEMGFEGIVCTDAMNMSAVAEVWDQTQAVVNAIRAGVDLICMPCEIYDLDDLNNLDAILAGVKTAVEAGNISESRIDDAVTRILTVKENRGILDYDSADYSLEKSKEVVGSEENRSAEREMAAAAVTVIRNENDVLPLKLEETSKVLMLCPYNNERAQLVMGWNRAAEAELIPDGAQMDYYRYSGAEITEEIKEKLDWADTVIILSEVSSASKMAGNHWLSEAPDNFVNYAKENEKTAVVMSVDKPYDVQLYPNAGAILAVYGCKGSTVDPTEAMNGNMTESEAAYGPNIIAGVEVALGVFGAGGKLPVNIPEYDVSTKTYTEKIIYPRGYGLTYASLMEEETPDELPDEPKVELIEAPVISVGNVSKTGKIKVTWKAVEGAEKYEIYRSVTEDGTYKKMFTTTGLSYTNTSAKAGETYYYKVCAIGKEETIVSDFSTIEKCTCDLAAPKISISNNTSSGKIKVTWKAVEGAEKYEIYRSVTEDGTYKKMFTTTRLSYTNTSAKAGKTYYYKVKAVAQISMADSAYSTVKKRTCDLAKPVVSASNARTKRIKLTWKAVEGADVYEVYRATKKDGTYKKMFTTTKECYTNTAVKKGKTYYYKVRAKMKEVSSAASSYSTVVSKKVK